MITRMIHLRFILCLIAVCQYVSFHQQAFKLLHVISMGNIAGLGLFVCEGLKSIHTANLTPPGHSYKLLDQSVPYCARHLAHMPYICQKEMWIGLEFASDVSLQQSKICDIRWTKGCQSIFVIIWH